MPDRPATYAAEDAARDLERALGDYAMHHPLTLLACPDIRDDGSWWQDAAARNGEQATHYAENTAQRFAAVKVAMDRANAAYLRLAAACDRVEAMVAEMREPGLEGECKPCPCCTDMAVYGTVDGVGSWVCLCGFQAVPEVVVAP